MFSANVLVEWARIESRNSSEEVSRKAISTGGRCSIRAISRDHVIDCCHIDGIICDTDETGGYERGNPVDRRTNTSPCKAEEANGLGGCDE